MAMAHRQFLLRLHCDLNETCATCMASISHHFHLALLLSLPLLRSRRMGSWVDSPNHSVESRQVAHLCSTSSHLGDRFVCSSHPSVEWQCCGSPCTGVVGDPEPSRGGCVLGLDGLDSFSKNGMGGCERSLTSLTYTQWLGSRMPEKIKSAENYR